MRRFTRFIVVLGILAAIALLPRIIDTWITQSRSGPLHVYRIDDPPDFLTNELALAKAQDAMARDGFTDPSWRPNDDDRTASPDGTPDEHLVRNAINPNDGFILFLNEQEKQRRIVRIEFTEDHISCQLWIPK